MDTAFHEASEYQQTWEAYIIATSPNRIHYKLMGFKFSEHLGSESHEMPNSSSNINDDRSARYHFENK